MNPKNRMTNQRMNLMKIIRFFGFALDLDFSAGKQAGTGEQGGKDRPHKEFDGNVIEMAVDITECDGSHFNAVTELVGGWLDMEHNDY